MINVNDLINVNHFNDEDCFNFVCWHLISAFFRLMNRNPQNYKNTQKQLDAINYKAYNYHFSNKSKPRWNYITFYILGPADIIFEYLHDELYSITFKNPTKGIWSISKSKYVENNKLFLYLFESDQEFKMIYLTYKDIFDRAQLKD